MFLHRVFAVLARYDTIAGAGYQAAMPEPAFDALRRHFDVGTEGFASPLNCYLPRYHSAFWDVDRWFGSQGSFFDLRAVEGAYESNPPFLELPMAANALHVLGLMGQAEAEGRAMMVVVVWPGWDDTPGYVALMGSPLMRRLLVLHKGDHTYKEGYQHRVGVAYRNSQAKRSRTRAAPLASLCSPALCSPRLTRSLRRCCRCVWCQLCVLHADGGGDEKVAGDGREGGGAQALLPTHRQIAAKRRRRRARRWPRRQWAAWQRRRRGGPRFVARLNVKRVAWTTSQAQTLYSLSRAPVDAITSAHRAALRWVGREEMRKASSTPQPPSPPSPSPST